MTETKTELPPNQQRLAEEAAAQLPAQVPAVADRHGKIAERAERKPRRPAGESIVNIAGAIAAVTAEVGVVAKAGHNKFHGYKFAQMQDVLQKITPLIAKHGLVIVQTELTRNMLDDGRAVAVEYEFTIAHTSGEMWPDRPRQTGLCRCRDSKGGFDDKAFNKCHTAARKYFLLALFQIATGDEDDADGEPNINHSARPAPHKRTPIKPAQGEMVIDPETGEILEERESVADNSTRAAADAAPPLGGGGAALSLEDMGRAAAARGEAIFRTFYRNRSGAEQMKLNAIGDELRQLMQAAKERKNVQQ